MGGSGSGRFVGNSTSLGMRLMVQASLGRLATDLAALLG